MNTKMIIEVKHLPIANWTTLKESKVFFENRNSDKQNRIRISKCLLY